MLDKMKTGCLSHRHLKQDDIQMHRSYFWAFLRATLHRFCSSKLNKAPLYLTFVSYNYGKVVVGCFYTVWRNPR